MAFGTTVATPRLLYYILCQVYGIMVRQVDMIVKYSWYVPIVTIPRVRASAQTRNQVEQLAL